MYFNNVKFRIFYSLLFAIIAIWIPSAFDIGGMTWYKYLILFVLTTLFMLRVSFKYAVWLECYRPTEKRNKM